VLATQWIGVFMGLLEKVKKYIENDEIDRVFELHHDPSLTKDELGQLFVIMATLSNPVTSKIILQLPETPNGFPDKANKTCMDILNRPDFDINGIIEVNGQKDYPLQIAVILGSPDLVKYVIEKGANVNLNVGDYPIILSLLSFASEKTLPTMYKMSFGFEPKNPAEIANNYKIIIKVLIEGGADTNVKDPNTKMTFLQLSQELGLEDIVKTVKKKQGLA